MASTPIFSIPYLYSSQAQKDVTVNTAFQTIDSLLQFSIISRSLLVAPTLPNDGDKYIVGQNAVGVWAGHDNAIAVYSVNGALWTFYPPQLGWVIFSQADTAQYVWTGAVWSNVTAINLDSIGSTQGDILYRGASAWTVLPPGAAGAYLRSGGAGAAPSWVHATGTFTLNPSTTTTTVTDSNCSTTSIIMPRATTADAALDMDQLWIVEGAGSFVVHHANNALTDRTFKYVVI